MSQLGSFVAPRLAATLGVALAIVLGGCGGKSSSTNKYPDASSTTGTGGTVGAAGAGAGGLSAGTGGIRAGTGGTVGAGGSTAAGNIGKACTAVADCGAGLTCLLPTDKRAFGAGGPANGYCTVACAAVSDCPTGSTCVETKAAEADPTEAYCFQVCTPGKPATGTLKCQGRDTDVACSTLAGGPDGGVAPSVCLPVCSQDKDCPAGRKCDEFTSVCVDTQQTGLPQGAHCDLTAMAAAQQCAGQCLAVGSGNVLTASFCSRRCVFGNLEACNWVSKDSPLSSGGSHGLCIYADANADRGDEGFCGQECDATMDCSDKTDPGGICDVTTLADPSLMLNSHGLCTWSPATDAGARD